MIWDFLNSIVRAAADTLHAIYSSLPASPIYIPASIQSELTPIFGKLAWFFPIAGMATFLALYLVAVFVLAGVLLIKQLIEAALP